AAVQDQIEGKRFGTVALGSTESVSGNTGRLVENLTIGAVEAAFGGIPPLQFFKGGPDRPIGLAPHEINGNVLPNTAVILTREIIESALTATYPPVVNPTPSVLISISKPGILVITFQDQSRNIPSNTPASDARALYSMALQV